MANFMHKVQFYVAIEATIFRQKQPGYWAEVVCHFHLPFFDNIRFVIDESESAVQRYALSKCES